MGDRATGQGEPRAVPVIRIFPWWYLVGAITTVAALIVLEPDGSQAMGVFWGPAIGVAIQDRQKAARARLDKGLPVDRASLRSPRWLEPVCAVLLTAFAIGLGLLLNAVLGHGTPTTLGVGSSLLAGSAIGLVGLFVALRATRRRPQASDRGGL